MKKVLIQSESSQPFLEKEILNNLILITERLLNLKTNLQLSLVIVDINTMAKINYKYAAKSKPTDVLSFPLNINKKLTDRMQYHFVGEIFICPEIINKNAKQKDHTMTYESSFMFVHSLLHLLNFDHNYFFSNFRMNYYVKKILKKAKLSKNLDLKFKMY